MNVFQRAIAGILTVLFLGLTFGVEIYSVHCNMSGEKIISLSSGYDPCLSSEKHLDSKNDSCCSERKNDIPCLEKEEDNRCCDEEEIYISYEPDAFSQIHLFIPVALLIAHSNQSLPFFEFVYQEKELLPEFPQPPPKIGREILNLHCVWRI